LRLSKYRSPFVCTYPDLCRNRHRHARPLLYLNLNLSLNLVLYPALDRAPFQKPFEKPNPSSLRSLSGFRNRSLSVRVGVAPCSKTLLPGRPLYAGFQVGNRHQPG
jgi:hypothetical protein